TLLSTTLFTPFLPPFFFFLMIPRPPTSTLFPYTTLFRSLAFTPIELSQGPAQKIFYLHMPAAVWAELAMVLVGLAGVFYLFLKRSEEHTSELQSRGHLVCRLLLEKKKKQTQKVKQ